VIDATPVMTLPEKGVVPPAVVIVTLCGIDGSAFEKAIRNGVSAGALTSAGEKRKSLASIATITRTGVGFSVGCGVGFGVGVGVGVGRGVGVGVGRGVGLGVGVGFGVGFGVTATAGVGVGDGIAAAMGLGRTLAAASDGEATETGDVAGPWIGDGDAVADSIVWDVPSPADPGTEAPQAATNMATAISRDRRARGTAAL
jgi:hypothetical protein